MSVVGWRRGGHDPAVRRSVLLRLSDHGLALGRVTVVSCARGTWGGRRTCAARRNAAPPASKPSLRSMAAPARARRYAPAAADARNVHVKYRRARHASSADARRGRQRCRQQWHTIRSTPAGAPAAARRARHRGARCDVAAMPQLAVTVPASSSTSAAATPMGCISKAHAEEVPQEAESADLDRCHLSELTDHVDVSR